MTRCVGVDPQCPSPAALDAAASLLRGGGIVAYLTDTVYGLAVDARLPQAIAGLFALKGRPPDKAVPLIIGSLDQLTDIAVDVPRHAGPLMSAFWPGPLTLLFRPQPDLPVSLLGHSQRIGVRWPDSALSQGLALRVGSAITASSANRSGAPAALNAAEAAEQLAPQLDLVLDSGPACNPQVSTVLDVTTEPPRLIRQGRVSQAAMEAVLDCSIVSGPTDGARKA